MVWDKHLKETGRESELEEAYAHVRETYGTEKAIIPWEYEGKVRGVIEAEYFERISDIFGMYILIVGFSLLVSQSATAY